jgi:hypothetical protein
MKPVAWISKHSLKDIEQTWELTSLSPTKDDYFDTPLYTAPRELNLMEINEIADECFGTVEYELWKQINNFAEAILKKASEK